MTTTTPNYQYNFPQYASDLLKIRSRYGQITPFTLNVVQKSLDDILYKSIAKRRTFIYILKARQTGVSTWAEARIFHRTTQFPNSRGVIIAHEADASENIYNMSRFYYENLPPEQKPLIKYSSKKQLVFENPSKTDHLRDPGLRSRIEVMTAGRQTSGRSFTFTCFHGSEFAFWPDSKELLSGLIPTLPSGPGHFAIFETTANGTDHFSYEEWKRYKDLYTKYDEESEFIPIFIAWYDDPNYTKAFTSKKQKQQFINEILSYEDKDLQKYHKLTYEQMFWRHTQIEALGGDLVQFMREYPSTDEEAFVSSGRPVFDPVKVAEAITNVNVPKFLGEIDHSGKLTPLPKGRLTIWHPPRAGHTYSLGIDTVYDTASVSSKEPDNAVIQVIDDETLTQVAEWADRIDPVSMAPYVLALARLYSTNTNPALLVPERNGSGITLINEIQRSYWNIYHQEIFDRVSATQTDRLGFLIDNKNKPLLIDFSAYLFHNGYCKINSLHLLSEMRSLQATDSSSGAAKRGHKDDRIFAWMLPIFVIGKDRETFSISLYDDSQTDTIKVDTVEKLLNRLKQYPAMDLDELPSHQSRRQNTGSWLSY